MQLPCKISTVIIMLSAGILFGQHKDKTLLDSLTKHYLSSVPFQVTIIIHQKTSGQEKVQETNGTFILGSNDRFRVEFPDQSMIFDGKWLWSVDKTNNQIVVEEFNPKSSVKFIYDMIKGDWSGFSITGTSAVKSAENLTEIRLIPKDKNAFFKSITLTINEKTGRLQKASCQDFQKNRLTIRIENESPCSQSEKELFRTDHFQTKQLIDLRP